MKKAKATAPQFVIRDGSRLPHRAAQAIGEELSRLAAEHGGSLTAAIVLQSASAQKSPFHPFIEWDDVRAAQLYREWQARYLLNSIAIVVEESKGDKGRQDIRAFHVIETEQSEDSSDQRPAKHYMSIEGIVKDPQLVEQVIVTARRDLSVWRDRYQQYAAVLPEFGQKFKPVFEVIEKVV